METGSYIHRVMGTAGFGLDSPFPTLVLVLWAVLAVLVTAVAAARLRGVVRPGYLSLLVALRLTGLLAVLALLLQPYVVLRRPDRNNFQVAVLADVSGSMKTQDIDNGARSRLNVVRDALLGRPEAPAAALLPRLSRDYRLRTFLFADELSPYYGQEFEARPGKTAIGTVLGRCQEQAGTPPLGGVLLLSDGISNTGETPEAVAKRFRSLGIPVSCIGVGERREQGDVRVRFQKTTLTGTKGQPLDLVVELENTLPRTVTAQVNVQVDGQPAGTRSVKLGADARESWTLPFTPQRPGFQTAVVKLARVPGDYYPETDLDFAGLQITDPPVFKLLYLGASLNWEYKFIQLAAGASSQIKLAAVIRSGPKNFYVYGLPDNSAAKRGFTGLEKTFSDFDGILLDLRLVPELAPEAVTALEKFVVARGGGLFVFGPLPEPAPAAAPVRRLLPVSKLEPRAVKGRQSLEISPNLIFDQDKTGLVHAPPDPVAAAPQTVYSALELKPGARPVVWLKPGGEPLMAAHAYGSGRVLYAGLDGTWAWHMETDVGMNRHNAFWQNVLVWLASGSKPVISSPVNGRKYELGGAVSLNVDVLTPGFEPAVDAQVTAVVTDPAGRHTALNLAADAGELGRFNEPYVPADAGEYRVQFKADLTGGLGAGPKGMAAAPPAAAGDELVPGLLQYEARFLVRPGGAENQDTVFREKALRDIALITGGRYWSYRELDAVAALPVSAALPLKTERYPLCDYSLCLLLFLAAFAAEWFARRRIGLK